MESLAFLVVLWIWLRQFYVHLSLISVPILFLSPRLWNVFYFLFFIRKEPRNSRQLHGFSSLWLDNSNTLHPCLRQITTLINFHPFNPKYCSQQQCPVWKNTTHQLFKNRKQTQKRHFYVYIYIYFFLSFANYLYFIFSPTKQPIVLYFVYFVL